MARVIKTTKKSVGYDFIDDNSSMKNPYEKRIVQAKNRKYRNLSDEEIETLKRYNNYSSDWTKILVTDVFSTKLIRNSNFYGLVRIGNLEGIALSHKKFTLTEGIYNSTIISSDIGDNCALHDVKHLAYYIVGNLVMIHDVSEIQNTSVAHYGLGVKKKDETEADRIWVELGNENGSRGVLAFESIKASDVFLMYKFKDDSELQEKLVELCQKEGKEDYGYYGRIGDECVIKATRFILNTNIGDGCYIKGANKLKDLTVLSDLEFPVQIGEGVELVHGVMQKGSKAFYGVKAVRFILSQNATLKYGARLINSYLGDNSTISCCEVLNSFICPNHEQHHNNSFLVAATFLGQSNMAAGATIGSNHNSRANDGEIVAGRGFWPGLSVTLKHNSKFASFNLIAKGSYPAELNVKLPFCLISNDLNNNRLVIMPAYWFLYNMYALGRNSWKFKNRDKRPDKSQYLEYGFLAPDTAIEIVKGVKYLESQELINNKVIIEGKNEIENHHRGVEIVKVKEAIQEFKDQLVLYFVESFLAVGYLSIKKESPLIEWVNVGNQLITVIQLEELKKSIKSGQLTTWEDIHSAYQDMAIEYPQLRLENAYLCLIELDIISGFDTEVLASLTKSALDVRIRNTERIRKSRSKDFTDSFRKITCDSDEEFKVVFGELEENNFITESVNELENFELQIADFL